MAEALVVEVADAAAIVVVEDITLIFSIKCAINLGILLQCVILGLIKDINLIHHFLFKILQVKVIFNRFNPFRTVIMELILETTINLIITSLEDSQIRISPLV